MVYAKSPLAIVTGVKSEEGRNGVTEKASLATHARASKQSQGILLELLSGRTVPNLYKVYDV